MSLPPLLARPDRGAPPPPPLCARETVLNHPGCLRSIFAFVPDSFRFVAPVSQTFRRHYLAAHHNSTRTLLLYAVATPRTAQLWLDGGLPVMPLAVMAAHWGRLDVLRYLHDGGWQPNPPSDGRDILMAAAPGGHFHVWEWALTNEVAVWNDNASYFAAMNGQLDVLRCVQSRDYVLSWREFFVSAMKGHLNVVAWLHKQGYPWDASACAGAAAGGHLYILQWLRAHDCPWDVDTCSDAVEEGEFEILQWARANGCPWDAQTCAAAARQGDLPTLQWVRANGCDWDEETCFNAANLGYLDILQWARANGCPWDAAACFEIASDEEHMEIQVWMITTGNI
jgi:hypothetical protein